jgi:hypothetical protein
MGAYIPIRRKPVPPPIVHTYSKPIHQGAQVVNVVPANVATIETLPRIEPVQKYNSLPARLKYDLVEVVPRRGQIPRQEEFWPPAPSRGRSESRKLESRLRSSSRGRSTLVSYSPTRQIVIRENSSRRPRSSSRKTSTPSRSLSRSAAPVLHLDSIKSIEYKPRRSSRRSVSSRTPSPAPSRLTDSNTTQQSSPASVASSDFSSPRSRAATKGRPPSLFLDHARGAPLSAVCESPISPVKSRSTETSTATEAETTTTGSTTTTRYRYRYTPVEDDNESIKSFVRSIEQGGHARARAHLRTTSLPPPSTPRSTATATTSSFRSTFSPERAGRRPKHARTQSASQWPPRSSSPVDASPARPASVSVAASSSHRSASVARSARSSRSASTAPSRASRASSDNTSAASASTVSEKSTPTISTSEIAESRPSPRPTTSSGRQSAKFMERFSVCLDPELPLGDYSADVVEPVVPLKSEKPVTKEEERRMRRMRRVLKMAEYAAGRR